MSLHTLFLDIEASKGNGEDSHLIYDDDCSPFVVLGAFDGLGGRSAGFDGMTGGRIASKEATKITKMVLEESQGMLTKNVATQLQNRICQFLQSQAASKMVKSRLSGTLTGKRLCTTIALASIPRQIELESSPCEISLAWMGDSRIYFLSPQNGLQQLTKDDLEVEKDAFEMIREDPPMSQYLTADIPSNWQINFCVNNLEEKGYVLVCTDGCFQYLSAPWELEKLLLETLATAGTFEEWKKSLIEQYEYIKQDDVSLILYPIGFSSFDEITKSYQERLKYLDSKYNSEASENTLSELWNFYRCDYEARLNPKVSKKGAIKNIASSLENSVKDIETETHCGSQSSKTLPTKDDNENYSVNNDIDSNTSHLEDCSVENPDSSESSRLQQVESLLTQASKYEMLRKFPEAVKLYQPVLDCDHNNQKALIGMATAYYQLNNYTLCVSYFDKIKKITQHLDEKYDEMYIDSLQQLKRVQNE